MKIYRLVIAEWYQGEREKIVDDYFKTSQSALEDAYEYIEGYFPAHWILETKAELYNSMTRDENGLMKFFIEDDNLELHIQEIEVFE